MPMSFADIVKFGLAKEKNAGNFYRRWASCLKGPDKFWSRAKTMLLWLAAEEEEHQKIFEKIKAADLSLNGKGNFTELNAENYTSGEDMPNDANGLLPES